MLTAIVVLPTPPFGLKTMTIWPRCSSGSSGPPPIARLVLLQFRPHDPAVGVLDRDLRPDEHGLYSPPERLGRVGASEVLVVDAASPGQAHAIEGAGGHDHQRRDVAILVVEQRIHLKRSVEVVLAVQDGDADVAAPVQQRFEVVGGLDLDRLIAGLERAAC
jgi:hypothetical protein